MDSFSFYILIRKDYKTLFLSIILGITHYANCIIFAHIPKMNSVSTSFEIKYSKIIQTHSFLH